MNIIPVGLSFSEAVDYSFLTPELGRPMKAPSIFSNPNVFISRLPSSVCVVHLIFLGR